MITVLLVDDEPRMLDLLSLYLIPRGYQCLKAVSGEQALGILQDQPVSLVLLDVMMPGMDGWETCWRIRDMKDVPIIMLTARNQPADIVHGLRYGADDYVTKPFHEEELLARMEAVLRRTHQAGHLEFQELVWDEEKHLVTVSNKEVALTPIEFSLLGLLLSHPHQVFSREQLIERIWGLDSDTEDRTVDSHVRNLRDKLRRASFPIDDYLKTVYGVGYRWTDHGA
ncbi:response regulator transcription factor [Ectobacillus ponti]|uniref:Response regulator transcription factor n=1 Tax=Ectobacillus ponti TaxID=2961894 RepID=A0AA42BR99_9BACI|nr:response regulator transcription factor [Ectobacillus ponti]MCP8969264.1 response regulator transcription factor [Ectobacillus ponti]